MDVSNSSSVSASGGESAVLTSKARAQPGSDVPYATEVSVVESMAESTTQLDVESKTTEHGHATSQGSDKSSVVGERLSQEASQEGLNASGLEASKAHELLGSTTFSATAKSGNGFSPAIAPEVREYYKSAYLACDICNSVLNEKMLNF